MKKLALIPLVILVLGVFALPAYATHYAPLSVSCTLATGGWTAFEGAPNQILTIHVTQPGSGRRLTRCTQAPTLPARSRCHCPCQGTDSSR